MAVIKKIIRRTLKLIERHSWVIPLFGFVSGVASFFLVERKQEQFAQIISILMLASWLWLSIENVLQRGISQWFGIKVPPVILRYVNQLVHQESLFFVIPFFFITTAWNSGQMVFTSLLIVSAIVSLIDPIYYHWLAPRRWLYYSFHGIALFAALLTALPLLFHLPTSKSYLWALGIAAVLSSPGIARSISVSWLKQLLIMLLLVVTISGAGILVRPWIPPASIWLTQVAITDRIDNESRSPNKKFKVITNEQIHAGVYAYTAIHAPRGLNERIYHTWYHNGKEFDKMPLNISGGNEDGYRSWSHKMNFPQDATGDWQIRVVTEAKQMLGILRFEVVNSYEQNSSFQKTSSSSSTETKIEKTETKTENPEETKAESKEQSSDISETNSETDSSSTNAQASSTNTNPEVKDNIDADNSEAKETSATEKPKE